MFENLHKISLISIEKAPVTQPNIYSLAEKQQQIWNRDNSFIIFSKKDTCAPLLE